MSAQKDLHKTLKTMQVACDEIAYVFITGASDEVVAADSTLATFRETEGMTAVVPLAYAQEHGFSYEGTFAKLSIDLNTSLKMVGLTAALTTALTQSNIPANVLAAYYHDHIFVPYPFRHEAVTLLNGLKHG